MQKQSNHGNRSLWQPGAQFLRNLESRFLPGKPPKLAGVLEEDEGNLEQIVEKGNKYQCGLRAMAAEPGTSY